MKDLPPWLGPPRDGTAAAIRFGGGCGTSYANNTGSNYNDNPVSNYLLSRGYAVVTSTLNTFQAMCNPTLSAEVTALSSACRM